MMTVGGGIFALRRPRPCSRAYAGMQMRHAAKPPVFPCGMPLCAGLQSIECVVENHLPEEGPL